MINLGKIGGLLLLMLALQACGPKTIVVKNSELAAEPYAEFNSAQTKQNIAFKSIQTDDKKAFSYGRLKINLHIDGAPVDPVDYLATNVTNELSLKGIDVENDVNTGNTLNIEQFYLRNHRTNGYTPFITFGIFKGSLRFNGEVHDISVFVKRGKVPVWSFNEIIEPTLNEPLALISKEVAAKINHIMFGRQISDAQVDALVLKIKDQSEEKSTYLLVYELGFGNNPKAIKSLVEFSQYDEEYIRLAAISSLGILQAESQIDYLWSIFESDKIWQDRAMAIKALGDINSSESIEKLKQARNSIGSEKQRSKDWFNEILDLYL